MQTMTATDYLAEMATWAGAGIVACVVIRIAVAVTWSTYLLVRSIIGDVVARK